MKSVLYVTTTFPTLATFIAIHAGFRVVVIAALVLYGVAAWTMGALQGDEGGEAGSDRCSEE